MVKWTEREDFVRVTLLKQNKSYKEIADEMNSVFGVNDFTENSVRNRSRRTNTAMGDLYDEPVTFEEAWDTFCKLINMQTTCVTSEFCTDENINDFIVLSDFHVPVHNEEAMIDAVEWGSRYTKTCIVAGDFLDTGSFSPHFIERPPTVLDEIKTAKLVANYLDSKFDNVIYLRGNHELWYNKAKMHLPPQFRPLLKDNLLDYVLLDLSHSRPAHNFFVQIGDCVVAHPSAFTKKRMVDVYDSFKYFDTWKNLYGLSEIRCYVHAHIHQLGSRIVYHGGAKRKLFEGGCLCAPSENLMSGRVVQFDPPTEGWVFIEQKNGKTDFNTSREYVWGQ